MIIPLILLHTKYSSSKGFFFDETSSEHLGVIYRLKTDCLSYSNQPSKFLLIQKKSHINKLIEMILEIIKENGYYVNSSEIENLEQKNLFGNLTDLLEEFSEENSLIHFSLKTRAFVNGYYKYHRIVVNRAAISLGEESDPSPVNSQMKKIYDKNIIIEDKDRVNAFKNSGIKINKIHRSTVRRNVKEKIIKQNEDDDKENNIKNEKFENKIEFYSIQSSGSVASVMANLDLLYYLNIFKNKILVSRDSKTAYAIKISVIIFLILTAVLLWLFIFFSIQKVISVDNFLLQNQFFSKTKIYFTTFYSTLRSVKENKYGIYDDEICKRNTGKNCLQFNKILLKILIEDYSKETKNFYEFSEDLKSILYQEVTVNTKIYKDIRINKGALINLIISTGLNIYSNLDEMLLDFDTIRNRKLVSTSFENLENHLLRFLINSNEDYIEFIGHPTTYISRKFSYTKYFAINLYVLVINFVLLFILVTFIIYLSILSFRLKKRIVVHLLDFHQNELFLVYLNNLTRLFDLIKVNDKENEEKTSKNENSESRESLEHDLKKPLKNGEIVLTQIKENVEDHSRIKAKLPPASENQTKNLKESKLKTKKEKNAKKLKQQKEFLERKSKISKLTNFFYSNLIKLITIILAILFISLTFYMILLILTKMFLNKTINIYENINLIDSVYQHNFGKFLDIKKNISDIIDEEIRYFVFDQRLENELDFNKANGILADDLLRLNFSKNFYSNFFTNSSEFQNREDSFEYFSKLFSEKFSHSKADGEINNSKNFDQMINELVYQFEGDIKKYPRVVGFENLYHEDICPIIAELGLEENLCRSSENIQGGISQVLSSLNLLHGNIIENFKKFGSQQNTISTLSGDEYPLNFVKILGKDFGIYENIIRTYFYKAYIFTYDVSRIIFEDNSNRLQDCYIYLFVVFVLVLMFFLFLIFGFINKFDRNLKSFLNFLNIIPTKYLIEDMRFARLLIKLREEFL